MKTGRSRPSPTYYRSSSASSRSPFERTPQKRRRFWAKLIDLVVIIAVLAVAVYSLILNSKPRLIVSSQTYRSATVYQKAATGAFKDFKNRNKITLDEKAVITSLKKQFPEIATASVNVSLFSQTPTLRLSIASPDFNLNSRGSSYIVDSQGVVVAKSVDLPQIKNLLPLSDESNFDAKVGSQVLSASDVNFINSVIAQVKRAKVPVASLILPPRALEIDMRTADRGYFVKFFLGGDSLTQAGQFLAARHQFDQTNNQPSEYLDVRVPGKIYYR